jgi:hypothetical protein
MPTRLSVHSYPIRAPALPRSPRAEYEAIFGPTPQKFGFNPATYDKLKANPVVRLKGDYDAFGDGSGDDPFDARPPPGHQSLMVRLQKTGVVMLSGDLTSRRTGRRAACRA